MGVLHVPNQENNRYVTDRAKPNKPLKSVQVIGAVTRDLVRYDRVEYGLNESNVIFFNDSRIANSIANYQVQTSLLSMRSTDVTFLGLWRKIISIGQ